VVSVLLTYGGKNGPREVGGSDVVRSTVGSGEALAPRMALAVVVMTGGPPPSSSSAREALVWWVDGASLGDNGG
jgi:hypothetical protein